MRRTRILLALAPEGVLVGATNTGKPDLHEHCTGLGLGHRKIMNFDATWPLGTASD